MPYTCVEGMATEGSPCRQPTSVAEQLAAMNEGRQPATNFCALAADVPQKSITDCFVKVKKLGG